MLIYQAGAAHAQAGDAEIVQLLIWESKIPSIHAVFLGFDAVVSFPPPCDSVVQIGSLWA
jgi:hypothetical protein